MKARSWLANVIATLVLLLSGCATTTSPPAAAGVDSTKAQITILYDAFGKSSTMQKDWGYAALIEFCWRLTVGRSAASRASKASGPSESEGGESAATPC